MNEIKIGLISSCGGHLTELRALNSAYQKYEHFYVLNDIVKLPADMQESTYFIRHSERDLLFFVNLFEAWKILRKEQPSVLLSTGAGPIVPFALVGKLLGIPSIFVESAAQLTTPSLSGRIMYHLADRFFYQWKSLQEVYPDGVYGGLLL